MGFNIIGDQNASYMINNYKKFGLHLKCNKYKACDNPNGSI